MSTVIANSAAANANYLAARAREQACEALVQSYHGSADPAAMRSYAECVSLLYPDSMSPELRLTLQVLAVGFLAVFGCAVALFRCKGDDWLLSLTGGLVAVLCLAIVIALAIGLLHLFL